jgi:hypothetical protein
MCTPPWIRPGSVLRQVPNFGFVLISARFTLSFFCVFVFKRVFMTKRCSAEIKQAHKQFARHMTNIIRKLSYTSDSIVTCVSGQCGQLCKKHSLVCSGGRKAVWKAKFLPPGTKLHPNLRCDSDRCRVSLKFSMYTVLCLCWPLSNPMLAAESPSEVNCPTTRGVSSWAILCAHLSAERLSFPITSVRSKFAVQIYISHFFP